ncbi:MAG: prepilin-type N-terminal cleavage/methylation domain-containing protein [Desulfamplus sp.]|nr:prepilin-type N-terminal cleavage/methylation domain-containing protein [Desulfamplus sp.]
MKYSSKKLQILTIKSKGYITSNITFNIKLKGLTLTNIKGFTLIEIMVVMILIAIAGSLVLMNVGQSGRMKERRMFADKMVSMCKTARLTAVGKGIPACLTISPEKRECRISFIEDPLTDIETSDDKATGVLFDEQSKGSSGDGVLNGDSVLNGNGNGVLNGDGVLKIPENILLEGEQIKATDDGVYFICFYPDGSSGGGILTISVENEFEFTFQVDMLTGSIREITSDAK